MSDSASDSTISESTTGSDWSRTAASITGAGGSSMASTNTSRTSPRSIAKRSPWPASRRPGNAKEDTTHSPTVVTSDKGIPVNLRKLQGTTEDGTDCEVEYWSGTVKTDTEGHTLEDDTQKEVYMVLQREGDGKSTKSSPLSLDEIRAEAEHSAIYKRIYTDIMAERRQSSATAVSSEAEEGEEGGTGSNIDTGTYTAEGGGSSPSDSGHGSLGSFKFTYTASDGRGRMNKREDSVSIRWTDHTASIGGGRRYTIDRTGNEEGSFISISGLTLDEVKRHYEGNGGYMGAAARRIIDFEKQSGHSQGARPISTSSPGRSSAG